MRVLIPVLFVSTCFAAEIDVRLPEAVTKGDKAAIRTLISQKVDVNAPLSDGTTAIHWAVRSDDLETVNLLIKAGADVKSADRYGVTPLYLACVNGNAAIIAKLLDAGADANASVANGETALMTAAHTGTPDALKVLIDHGAKVNATDTDSESTALMRAVREGHADAVKLLLARGADAKARTRIVENFPPETGNLQGVGRAQNLPKGVPPGGMTALMYAVRDGHVDIAEMLIAAGADVNQVEANKTSPLVVAIINNHPDTAMLLIKHGADVNAADGFGRAPLWSAVDVRNLDLDSKNGENGVDRAPVLDLIKELLAKGADPNLRIKTEPPTRRWMQPFGAYTYVNPAGQTPFHRAALSGDVTVMKLLLEKGADPNIATNVGVTPLMAASGISWIPTETYVESKESLLEAVKLCVEKGADVNAASNVGFTAVHGAAYRGSNDIIEYLVSKGAKLDVKDKQGRTPLTFAEGVFLAAKPPEAKPATIALIKKLMGA